jgi:signal transduction histidine kinase
MPLSRKSLKMAKQKKKKIEELAGGDSYVNHQCWLADTLGYSPVNRCRYCDIKFRECLFFQHLIVSLVLVVFLLGLSYLVEGGITRTFIVSIIVLIVVYSYFFSRSTEKIIKVNFAEKKAREALDSLNQELEKRVEVRTRELEKAYQELQALDRAKTEFISIASHQLRTPLGAMRGYLSMLINGDFGVLGSEAQRASQEVYQASLRLLKLSNDLLNVSQIESGKVALNYETVSVLDLINNILEPLKIEAKEKKVKLKVEADKDLPSIEIDADKIRQVLMNIIDNAIKYSQAGQVNIILSSDKKNLLIEIKDSGPGLSADDIDNLFRSFFRGQSGKELHPAGSGLGLYVAKKFVDQHYGCLWAESPGVGQGSSFFIELPIKKSKKKSQRKSCF